MEYKWIFSLFIIVYRLLTHCQCNARVYLKIFKVENIAFMIKLKILMQYQNIQIYNHIVDD